MAIEMEFAYEPYKKLSFHSYLPYESWEEFIKVIAMANPPELPGQAKLFWANGILFRFYNHPPSEALAEKMVGGHIIWDHIEFAPMEKYQNELKVAERPLVRFYVLNVSKHVLFAPLTAWIRQNLLKK
jgi:hypothetical protein